MSRRSSQTPEPVLFTSPLVNTPRALLKIRPVFRLPPVLNAASAEGVSLCPRCLLRTERRAVGWFPLLDPSIPPLLPLLALPVVEGIADI